MPLPKHYEFSPWVLKSKQAPVKPIYVLNPYQNSYNSLEYMKVPKPNMVNINTATYMYGDYITKTKEHLKSFNYTKADHLHPQNSIILDLHSEGTTIEKLDKAFDIRDGYVV